jgi:hypothetical protein
MDPPVDVRPTFPGAGARSYRQASPDYNGVSIGDFGQQSPTANFQYPNYPGGGSVRTCGDWFEVLMIFFRKYYPAVGLRGRAVIVIGNAQHEF